MQQNRARSSHKLLWSIYVPILFLLLGSICCYGIVRTFFPPETSAPETFPDAEIVFVASGRKVGFVSADGTNPEYIRLVVEVYGDTSTVWPWRPVMTGDNQTLIVKMSDTVKFIFGSHYLAIWRPGEFPVLCDNWSLQQMPLLTADQSHIFVSAEQGMAVYALESCGTTDDPIKVYEDVFGVPSPDLQYVAYTNRPGAMANDDSYIVIRSIANGEERVVGVGDYPVWSRDSQSLAYTGKDGIYIVSITTGAEPRRVVLYPNLFDEKDRTYASRDYWQIPPEVSWSPDGKWLVYHKWTGTEYDQGFEPYDNAIYKLNIETGEEMKIVDHGMYPYWRWPLENP